VSRDEWEDYITSPLPPLPDPERREQLRKQMGVTIEQAARKCGVTRLTYRQWEKGIWKPSIPHHRDYARLLQKWEKAVSSLG
jgi:DNA-binding XRE family transcriptional regulator